MVEPQKRTKHLSVRISVSEYEAIDAMAQRLGVSLADVLMFGIHLVGNEQWTSEDFRDYFLLRQTGKTNFSLRTKPDDDSSAS